jgi:hypothetical protein
MCLVSLN